MGTLYWQINDCWPVASWSSIDYFGRWKALHYLARRFFAPRLISGVEHIEEGTVDVHITSDAAQDTPGQIEWKLTDLGGQILADGTSDVMISARHSQQVQTLNLVQYLATTGKRNVLLWLYLVVGGETVSSNLVTFAKPKHLELRQPDFGVKVRQDGDAFKVKLTASHPALYTWLSLADRDVRCSDNFFHILPGTPVEITLSNLPENTTLAEVQAQLVVCSLTDTYR